MILSVFVAFGFFVLLVFLFAVIRWRIESLKAKKILSHVFRGQDLPLPHLLLGTSYSWPTFKITFDSSETFRRAHERGLLTNFEQQLRQLYGTEFDPSRAVTYLYEDSNNR